MHQQAPIHSPFNERSTASEVLKGLDLRGKLAVITGGHSGLGLESSRALMAAGAHVIVGARNAAQASSVLPDVEVAELDLADMHSVRRFAAGIVASGRHVDFLINNAGIMACPEQQIGTGKWESHFAVNHLGHFLLVQALWPALQGGSRVISVSSAGHHLSDIRWRDIHFNTGYDKWMAYAQSKTANALFAVHLDTIGQADGIRSFATHPGKIFTPLQRFLTREEMIAQGWLDTNGNPADRSFKTTPQGAATQVWAATSPLLNNKGGVYCEDCNIAPLSAHDEVTFAGVKAYAIDPVQAQRLWEISVEMISEAS
ncbi:oxidoreductase [Chitinophaga vietnamensis]|uniref:oxidoreductase n=1 Tax=Chitinophaga vietnamensis TaxID=2593957 RepID=UPI001177380C|nr:oxidoreductase [Chitinophaga vietnamensis]